MLRVHVVTVHWQSAVGSSTYVRLLLPLGHPSLAGRFVTTHSTEYAPADILIVERSWTDDMDQARDLVARARADRACLIYSTDDNILDLKIEGSVAQWLSAAHQEVIRYVVREAVGVIVSTEPLREQMSAFNDRVIVVPNALDERLLPHEPIARRDGATAPCVIGYMGTMTHDQDLAMIAPALQRVLRRHAGRVELQLVGAISSSAALRSFNDQPVRVIQSGHSVEYPSFMRWMGRELQWDIGLAPLQDDAFTRCKSDIKFLDYAALGIPGMFSQVTPYESVRHLETGCVAANEVDAWEEGLERLVTEPDLRQKIGRSARVYLLNSRTLLHKATQWRDAICSMRQENICTPSRHVVAASPVRQVLIVIPGSVNYFYNRAGERIAEALRSLGFQVDVRPIASLIVNASDDALQYEWCFLINLSELVAGCGHRSVALGCVAQLRARYKRTVAVALECASTSWFAASAYLCQEAGVTVLLDLGLHDQYEQVTGEGRRLYRFCFNGLTRREQGMVSLDPQTSGRPIPWAFIGSLSSERAALAWRLVREAAPEGFLYLPHPSPVTESGPHLNEQQFQNVLGRTRCQVWCSHHGHFYLEGERFRNSLLTGSLPLKVLTKSIASNQVLPFEYLMVIAEDAPSALRDLPTNSGTLWQRFVSDFLALPSLEQGLMAFLEDEVSDAIASVSVNDAVRIECAAHETKEAFVE